MHALEDLLRSILRRNMTPQGLQLMVEVCNEVHGPGEWAPGSQPSIVSQGPPCPRAAQESFGAFCNWGLWVGVQVGWALTQMGPGAHSCISFISWCWDAETLQVPQM